MLNAYVRAKNYYADKHDDKQLDCQFCGQHLSRPQIQRIHEKSHTHQVLCPRLWCTQRFETWDEALEHGLGEEHDFTETLLYTCPLENCRITVTKRPMTRHAMKAHWNTHVAYGHVAPDIELQEVLAEPLPFKPFPLLTRIHEYCSEIVMGQNATSNRPMDAPTEGLHSPAEDEADDDGLEEEDVANLEEDSGTSYMQDYDNLFSEEHHSLILRERKLLGDWRHRGMPAPSKTLHPTHLILPPDSRPIRIGKEMR
ncbi:hypothetical protein FVEN_g1890 [Fusarium venenatum]|uniref:C2H2-type domain-containing protein n=1 Tax=Fusarium venenatum TaxID=56646 RepID=A0A2L2T0V5_9HYPO|nr:uncharacterized protein FVRRES_12294 [Fusarium venenatum]KAG8360307.1 hypothetical protein FVEN_g1890 [Fusarium venenatum]CEI39603.1 unnamed protein product [Fusarium venenatum]